MILHPIPLNILINEKIVFYFLSVYSSTAYRWQKENMTSFSTSLPSSIACINFTHLLVHRWSCVRRIRKWRSWPWSATPSSTLSTTSRRSSSSPARRISWRTSFFYWQASSDPYWIVSWLPARLKAFKLAYCIKVLMAWIMLKGTVPRDFWLQVFFVNQFPQFPKAWVMSTRIPLALFQIFSKISRIIRSWRCTTGVFDTGGKWKKIFHQKSFNCFV